MNVTTFLVLILVFFLVVWYWFNGLKGKVRVIYTRATGQEVTRMIKLSDRHVVFDSKRFDILPERHRVSWVTFLGIIGTWILTYHFVWYSRFPEDPREWGLTTADSPEVRHSLNQEEKFRAYQRAETSRFAPAKKGLGGLERWIPWICLLVCVILIYLIFKQNSDMNVMKKALQDILTRPK